MQARSASRYIPTAPIWGAGTGYAATGWRGRPENSRYGDSIEYRQTQAQFLDRQRRAGRSDADTVFTGAVVGRAGHLGGSALDGTGRRGHGAGDVGQDRGAAVARLSRAL